MAHKKKGHGPVPTGNRTHFGPSTEAGPPTTDEKPPASEGVGDQEQDPKRRLGNFQGKGEHAVVQPGGKNHAQRNNKR